VSEPPNERFDASPTSSEAVAVLRAATGSSAAPSATCRPGHCGRSAPRPWPRSTRRSPDRWSALLDLLAGQVERDEKDLDPESTGAAMKVARSILRSYAPRPSTLPETSPADGARRWSRVTSPGTDDPGRTGRRTVVHRHRAGAASMTTVATKEGTR
jgi:hypothetical protein